jgi:purine-cytosine permease-like protein
MGEEKQEPKAASVPDFGSAWIGVGAGLGMLFGLMLGQLVWGLIIGAALGTVLMAISASQAKKDGPEDS